MRIKSAIYEVTHPLLRMIRSSHFLIRRIFGVRIPQGLSVAYDPTTIALSRTLNRIVTEQDRRSFEMGVGQAALVSLSMRHHNHLELHGADCSSARVQSSTTAAQHNDRAVSFVESDLFSNVPDGDEFDLIFFNVPYVPRDQGRKLQLTKRLDVDGDQVWDGGVDGTEVLARFLQEAGDYLSDTGRLVFGVQNIFVSDERVCEVLEETGWELMERSRIRFVPSCCYIVRPKAIESPDADTNQHVESSSLTAAASL